MPRGRPTQTSSTPDLGEQMLRRALARSPGSACVQADGNRLPVRPGRADLVSFAQSWHWLDQEHAPAEMARVLRPGGWWAAWWNQAAPGEQWWGAYQSALTASCPSYFLQHLSPDWSHGSITRSSGLAAIIGQRFPDGQMRVPYTTRLWLARKPG
jgi:ubiquinone/menaquinone biosynthesis C-methylase UbiE